MEGVNKKLSLLGGDSVDIFKGIPFATAKTLENPQRHPGWQGTLKATDFKKRCLQLTITQDSTYGQEDCLYLNIWVPQGRKEGLDPSFPEDPIPPLPQNPKPWSGFHLMLPSSTALTSALGRGGGAHC